MVMQWMVVRMKSIEIAAGESTVRLGVEMAPAV